MAQVKRGDFLAVSGGSYVVADRDFTAYIGGNYIVNGVMYRVIRCYGNHALLTSI